MSDFELTDLDYLRRSRSYFIGLVHQQDDEIDRIRELMRKMAVAVRSVQAEHTRVVTAYGTWCRICSPQDGSWPCVARMELDAVLPPEEERG